jgi:hypothetical protein
VTELSPTQVALRELMILTKCYCDGEHPRLGHNCSFRPDVETLVGAVAAVLKICEADTVGDRAGHQVAYDIRRALLGLPQPVDESPPWREEGSEQCIPCPHGGTHGGEYCRACEQNTGEDEGEAYCRVHS